MECGGCTLCCELLPVQWLNKPVNVMCAYCDHGCTIQDTKDQECKDFNCMYAQVKGIPVDLRPDNCKVIFEKHPDNLIIATLDARYELSETAKKQIASFVKQGYTVRLGASDFRKPKVWQPTEQISQP